MTDPDDFRRLLREAEAGGEEAVWTLVQRLSPYLYRVVRRRMQEPLRRRFDSTDFVQMAWASFLLRDRKLTDFATESDLTAFLAAIAANKVRMGARATFQRARRDARREVAIDHPDAAALVSREPDPAQVVAFREAWSGYLRQQPEHHQRIVALRIEGRTYDEIAAELRLNERTVRRVLGRLCDEVRT